MDCGLISSPPHVSLLRSQVRLHTGPQRVNALDKRVCVDMLQLRDRVSFAYSQHRRKKIVYGDLRTVEAARGARNQRLSGQSQ